jgi:hypothetical protein
MQQRNRRPRHCRGTFGGTVVAPVQGDIGRVTKQSSDKRSAFKKNVGQAASLRLVGADISKGFDVEA